MKYILTVILLNILCVCNGFAQKEPEWDNTSKSKWREGFEVVHIPSSKDGSEQKAYMYKSTCETPQPLIVSLHTWSGDYSQRDPLIHEIVARDWNYIHPDFRGANRKPSAMVSPLVISDIEDAIKYALKHTNANPKEVHIIGVSGGGLATLAAYMNVGYPVNSFSAWAPISDLEAWYWESVGRGQKYAKDIAVSTARNKKFDKDEAGRRSPLQQAFPIERRKDAKLYIYEGIHDGYKGSVPITHSINMYNRLVGELKYGLSRLDDIMPKAASDTTLVSEREIIDLLTKRINPASDGKKDNLFGYTRHLYRKYGNIELTIFEGGHEQIPQALGLLPYEKTTDLKYNILTIGDSNGHIKEGWTAQLKEMMPRSTFVNNSQSGRTIGFDNNGQEKLNALKNIDSYLNLAQSKLKGKQLDYIIVCLGTNDTKKMFADRQNEVPVNLDALLKKIKEHPLGKSRKTKLVYVTPPPMRRKKIEDKYKGGGERIEKLIPELKMVAEKNGFIFIDVHRPLLGVQDYYAKDGVHMAGAGQEIIASHIINVIRKQ